MSDLNPATYKFAPLNARGPLPPGLSADAVAKAFKGFRHDLRPKRVLQMLGCRSTSLDHRQELRRRLDSVELRSGTGTDLPPLHLALWQRLTAHAFADEVFRILVEPAQYADGNLIFLDPVRFGELVRAKAPIVLGTVARPFEPESPADALAQFALAFALLQSGQAADIVKPLTDLHPAFADYFGVSPDSATESSESGSQGESSEATVVESLSGLIDDAEASMEDSGTVDPQLATETVRSLVAAGERALRERADALRGGGEWPAPSFVEDLRRFVAVLDVLLERVTAAGTPAERSPRTVDALQARIEQLAQGEGAGRAIIADARRIVDGATSLEHQDSGQIAVLDPVRSECARLRSLLAGVSPQARSTAESILNGSHPLAVLIRSVNDLDTFTDEELFAIRDRLRDCFGDELARAATRGRIRVAASDRSQGAAKSVTAPGVPMNAPPESSAARTSPDTPIAKAEGTEAPLPATAVGPAAGAALGQVVHVPPADSTQQELGAGAPGQPPSVAPPPPAPPAVEPLKEGAQVPRPTSVAVFEGLPAEALEDFEIAWGLVGAGRFGLGYHMCATLEALFPGANPPLPAAVPKALALSRALRSGVGDLAETMRAALLHLVEIRGGVTALPEAESRILSALIGVACLRPAVLLSFATVAPVLEGLELPGEAILRLKAVVKKLTQFGVGLNPAALKGIKEHAAWSRQLEAHRDACRQWLEQARMASIIYAPTTGVWRDWLSARGPLGRMFSLVLKEGIETADEVRQHVEAWRDDSYIAGQLERTDKELRGRSAQLRPIEARARTSLLNHTHEAEWHIERWLQLVDAQPTQDASRAKQSEIERCRQEIQRELVSARSELRAACERLGNAFVASSAVAALEQGLDDFGALFDPEVAETDSGDNPARLLSAELLGCEGLRLDEHWRPVEAEPVGLLACLRKLASSPRIPPEKAFRIRLKERDHLGSLRAIEVMGQTGVSSAEIESVRTERGLALAAAVRALRDRVESVQSQVARAASYDLLPESELLDLKARVESIRPEDTLVFAPVEEVLNEVEAAIQARRSERIRSIRKRLDTLAGTPAEARALVESALDSGNFLAANEYIDLLVAGQSIQLDESDDTFTTFFPSFARQFISFMSELRGRGELRSVVEDIRNNRSVGPVDMRRVPGAQARDAGALLDAWYAAKQVPRAADGQLPRSANLRQHLAEIFRLIGFGGVTVDGPDLVPTERSWRGELRTTPIESRDICVVPHFGSSAAGRYRLLCVWDRPSEEEILASESRQTSTAPLFVMYFGQMTEQRRRDLALLTRQKRITLLVVDETVIYFLCSRRGLRLKPFFQCLLPFTFVDPYVTTASLVPPEMFFGRTAERQAVFEPGGTNLVYGGRQLGKTALLREVARRHHDPSAGVIVKWIDLAAELIGASRPVNDIWPVMASALAPWGIVRPGTTTPDSFMRRVLDWMEANPGARIVLLLDEADAFLERDAEMRYGQLSRIKGLMDQTGRRFKVVFAGLHNVQRAARDPNSPVAHLGHAICIGPLLNNREAAEAVAMIVGPLQDLGYRFPSPDLPMRIVSHTNYYPSLIQIYCKHLLDHLTSAAPAMFDPRVSPPFEISSEHLDAVQSQELREKILDKFRLTLDLDNRYRVIALSIALADAERRDEDILVHGVGAEWVRETALYWWPSGFKRDSSIEAFEILLDEMVGLGVLRRAGEHGLYTLRSPNLVTLLGSQKEIESRLLDAASREPIDVFEAGSFHRLIGAESWARSPLTAEQESQLLALSNGVTVLCGSEASGLERVPAAIRAICEHARYFEVDGLTDAGRFQTELDEVFRKNAEGLALMVVPASSPWSDGWIHRAQETLWRKTSRLKFCRVVFVGDPDQVWRWTDPRGDRTTLVSRGVREMSLRPWSRPALARWLDDLGLVVGDTQARERIADITGRWSMPLSDLCRVCQNEPHRWAQHLESLGASIAAGAAWMGRFGLTTAVLPVVRVFAEFGEPLSVEEAVAVAPTVSRASIEHVLRWAELLAYVSVQASGRREFDRFVTRLVPTGTAR